MAKALSSNPADSGTHPILTPNLLRSLLWGTLQRPTMDGNPGVPLPQRLHFRNTRYTDECWAFVVGWTNNKVVIERPIVKTKMLPQATGAITMTLILRLPASNTDPHIKTSPYCCCPIFQSKVVKMYAVKICNSNMCQSQIHILQRCRDPNKELCTFFRANVWPEFVVSGPWWTYRLCYPESQITPNYTHTPNMPSCQFTQICRSSPNNPHNCLPIA